MGISIVRIDDRLIHGQVVEGWLRQMKVSIVVIVSDALAQKEDEQVLFSLAVPSRVRVDCLSVQDAAERLKGGYYGVSEVMVLAESPREILALLDKGVKFGSLNVGGLHFSEGKIPINDSLYVNREDCEIFEKIGAHNVVIELRALPGDRKLDVLSEIRKRKGTMSA